MSAKLEQGTPMADALQSVMQQKLSTMGWSIDDSVLAEYIILLMVNGKTQEQIAEELSTDLLDIPANDTGLVDFVRWVFDELEKLGDPLAQGSADAAAEIPAEANPAVGDGNMDTDMDDANTDSSIPTGPKSMRNGNQRTRDKRMLGHMNKALSDAPLHRVKGTAGTGRINTHGQQQPPRGPTPKGPRAFQNRGPAMQQAMANHMGGPQMNMQNTPFNSMTQQQQMQMLAMYEENARMMAQILSPQQAQQMFPMQGGFQHGGFPNQNQQPGKSLFERVEAPAGRQNGGFNRHRDKVNNHSQGLANGVDPTSSMEVEQSSQTDDKPDPETTVCKFNLHCTKADCPFVHQSPAAPPGISIDMSDTCSYGAACKNFKCVGKHPSPAKRGAFAAEVDCKFYPNCTNPNCPFRHPSMPPCRNGADCQVVGCKFSHSKIQCKFNPCLNPACPYKHVEGQRRGKFDDKVWINPEEKDGAEKSHVSDRKFVEDENAPEDLVIPGQEQGQTESQPAEGIVT